MVDGSIGLDLSNFLADQLLRPATPVLAGRLNRDREVNNSSLLVRPTCAEAINAALGYEFRIPIINACKADPKANASLTALAGNPACKDYKFSTRHRKCEVLAAPFMKCVARELGFLKADGSIDNTLVISQYKALIFGNPACNAAQYDYAVKKCGKKIKNYAFLKKAACMANATEKNTDDLHQLVLMPSSDKQL
ncbi:uncharacterized protein LOC108674637 [Hyalella azteca]|uniref:Uncharacterized protein LOC108674637 n=1 Tax=Hyalella azteca TaxID=294128 RepID=A0A8B7NWJ1_HYAAZ|nr:uncharacterized protein LOC108674637 [Hyalella azteca]